MRKLWERASGVRVCGGGRSERPAIVVALVRSDGWSALP